MPSEPPNVRARKQKMNLWLVVFKSLVQQIDHEFLSVEPAKGRIFWDRILIAWRNNNGDMEFRTETVANES